MIDVNRLNHSGSIDSVNGTPDRWAIQGTALYSSGSLVYHFVDFRLEPYLFGGAGGLRTARTIKITGDFKEFHPGFCLVGCSPNIQPTRFEEVKVKELNLGFHVGGGIRIPLLWRLSLRPELRFVHAEDVDLVHAVFGLSFGW